jgi:hypothetical protein
VIWQLFGLLFKKFGNFFNHLVTLATIFISKVLNASLVPCCSKL